MSTKPSTRMYRSEFQELAGIAKTRYFDLLSDPTLAAELDASHDADGRIVVNRKKALAYIKILLARRSAVRAKVGRNLGDWSHLQRGRPCPACQRRITRKRTTCRHCGVDVDAAAGPPQLAGRPCPECEGRIPMKKVVCRHCGAAVDAAATA